MKRKKHAFTLLEVMIVICIIGLVSSVVAFNLKGSLDEGKAFKTQTGAEKIVEILTLQIAKGYDIETVLENPRLVLEDANLVKNVDKILKDGWNHDFDLVLKEDGDLGLCSKRFLSYLVKKKKMSAEQIRNEYEWISFDEKEFKKLQKI